MRRAESWLSVMERTGVIVLCAFVLSILHSFCAADPNESEYIATHSESRSY